MFAVDVVVVVVVEVVVAVVVHPMVSRVSPKIAWKMRVFLSSRKTQLTL